MSDELKVQVTLTTPVRVSWPQVFEPKAIASIPNSKEVYSARFVFPHDHPDLRTLLTTALSILRKMHAASDEAGEELGKLQMTGLFVGGQLRVYKDFWWPFTTGDKMIADAKQRSIKKNREYQGYEDYMAGQVTLYAKAYPEYPPQLSIGANGVWVRVTPENRAMHKAKFFNGMNAAGTVSIAGTKSAQGWGVSCYLNALGADGGVPIGGGQREAALGFMPSVSSASFADDEIPY